MSRHLAFLPATDLLEMIRERKISSLELVDLYIQRIEEFDPGINAVVARDFEGARRRARDADEAMTKGEGWGALHGLPITIKDSFEVAGMPCTSGAPALKDHNPVRNADLVERMLGAGAIILGKTNLPLFAGDCQSYNAVYGQTNNPWNFDRVPGGSSGGAAAALAAGMTALELGSDIGGSIRNPAHMCGVFGHKSSFGIASMRGHIPPNPGTFAGDYIIAGDLAVAGPLARSARDLELALNLMAGPGVPQRSAWKLKLPPSRGNSLLDFRVGLWLDDPAFPVDASVRRLLESTVQRLSEAGARVEPRHPELDLSRSNEVFQMLLRCLSSPGLPEEQFEGITAEAEGLSGTDRSARACSLRATAMRHRDWLRLEVERTRMRQIWADFFDEFDVLLCPAFPVTAFPHDHTEDRFRRTLQINGVESSYVEASTAWAGLTGVVYLPSTTAPVGLADDGLPVGIQIVAPFLEDRTSIRFAELLEEVLGGFVAPAGFGM
jgi:amidase